MNVVEFGSVRWLVFFSYGFCEEDVGGHVNEVTWSDLNADQYGDRFW
jgi:hypothetical protein